MTALVKKIKNGRAYWYATESARVNGQPRVVRQRYLGTVEAIEAAFDAAYEPESIDVVEFGATAAMWALAGRINFGLWVDALGGAPGNGPQRGDLPAGRRCQPGGGPPLQAWLHHLLRPKRAGTHPARSSPGLGLPAVLGRHAAR